MAGGFSASAKLLAQEQAQQTLPLDDYEAEAFDLDMPFEGRFRFEATPGSSPGAETPSWRKRYDDPSANWAGERAMLNIDLIKKYISDLAEPLYYMAGPPGMVVAMRKMLIENGVASADIRLESFTGYNHA